MSPADDAGSRPLLVVAHPGHELRVHAWLEQARPLVCVLTDGSGRNGPARLASTRSVLGRCGATVGPIFGRLTDRALYAALLAGAPEPFVALADALAALCVRARVPMLVADAAEGTNPAHDVCRLVVDAAAAVVARRGHVLRRYEMPVDGPPDVWPAACGAAPVCIALDDAAFERKLAAARDYRAMQPEVEWAVGRHGLDGFRTESLWPIGAAWAHPEWDAPPLYERYGEHQVAEGHYARVVRWREHVRPIARALAAHVQASA